MRVQSTTEQAAQSPRSPDYYVVMIEYGKRGREAIVDPEMTRRDVVARIASGEYKNIAFIHSIRDGECENVTGDLMIEAYQAAISAAIQTAESC